MELHGTRPHPNDFKLFVTAAPKAYDGFGTRTAEWSSWQDRRGNQFRVVAIKREHEDWQRSRYASGLYPSYTLEEFEEEKRYGYAIPLKALVP